jgi:hypothetical protein
MLFANAIGTLQETSDTLARVVNHETGDRDVIAAREPSSVLLLGQVEADEEGFACQECLSACVLGLAS